ncbi:MAG: hypothetical protein R3314_04925 [Longimicrobiales bacterium]|nr:hypothetical protein [Longimicrobiales bacterium]
MTKLYRLVPVLALMAMTACDGTTTTEEDRLGTFNMTISGDISATLEGDAVWGETTDPDTNETVWLLWMATPEEATDDYFLWIARMGSRPGSGSYAIQNIQTESFDPGEIGAFLSGTPSGTSISMLSISGTLTVSSSSGDNMTGTFSIDLDGQIFSNNQATDAVATVTGSFDAPNGVVDFPVF